MAVVWLSTESEMSLNATYFMKFAHFLWSKGLYLQMHEFQYGNKTFMGMLSIRVESTRDER